MAEFKTRCPKCATAFRISEQLLNSAPGMVRCGSCLNVFNAKMYLEGLAPERASQAPSTTEADAKASATSSAKTRTNLRTGGLSSHPFLGAAVRATSFSPYGTTGNLFEREVAKKRAAESALNESEPSEDDEEEVDADEAWALELLKEAENEPPIHLKKVVSKAPAEAEPQQDGAELVGPTQAGAEPRESATEAKQTANIDDSQSPERFLEDALPPLESDPSTAETGDKEKSAPAASKSDSKPEAEATAATTDTTASEAQIEEHDGTEAGQSTAADTESGDLSAKPANTSAGEEHEEKVDTAEPSDTTEAQIPGTNRLKDTVVAESIDLQQRPQVSESRQKAIDKYTSGAKSEIPALHDVIATLEPEPLEVEQWQKEKAKWHKKLLWTVLAVVALCALLVQVAWLEFHRLNRVEPYRSLYKVACGVLNCELPEMIDRKAVKTSNLLVRSHPEAENALMVDVILQNDAEFQQTFPSLLLTFTDIKNQPVAVRKLLPEEYLGGELEGQTLMPVKHPIHISLEIVDPGSSAVSYSIAIVD